MTGFADLLVRRRWILLTFPAVAGAVLLAAGPDEGGTGSRVAVIVFGMAATVAALVLLLNLAGHDPDAETLAAELDPSPTGRALLARWLRRSKYYRFVGGAIGSVIGFGLVGNGGLSPVLFGLVAGIAVGGSLAEIHAIGRHRLPTRSAELSVRRIGDYVPRVDLMALAAVGAGALTTSLAALVMTSADRNRSLLFGAAALLTVALTGALQRLVVIRPRPALSIELRQADDLLRRLAASQGFTRPAIALGVGLLASSLDGLGAGAGYGLGAGVLWLIGLAWYVSSRQNRAGLVARHATAS